MFSTSHIIFIHLAFFLPGIIHASVKTLTMEDFLVEVRSANPAIQASKLRSISARHRVRPLSTLDDPFIAAGIDEIPFSGGRGKVRRYQISQSIPFPGKLRARSEIAESRAEASASDAETINRQIQVIATQTYLKASYNRHAIQLNERIQKIIQDVTASAKARYRTGDASHHEWLLAKLELSILNVDLLKLKRLQNTLHALMNELRNAPPDTPIDIDSGNFFTETKATGFESSLDMQPEMKAWNSQKKAADSELKLVKLSYAPDFVIQGMAMEPIMKEPGSMETSNWGVMVGVTVPIFFWRKQSELVAAAEKDRLATIAEYQTLENRLNTEMTDAKQQLQTSLDVVALYKSDVIPITEIAVKNARSSYATKKLALRQLLDALRSQKVQELELLAAQMDVFVSKTRIQKLLSNPPASRFAPARPTSFAADMDTSMSSRDGMDASPTINMGTGMSGPTRKSYKEDSSGTPGGMGRMQ